MHQSVTVVLVLLAATLAVSACERGRAPAEWAERNRMTTGAPNAGAQTSQPVDPKDTRATQDVRAGQERFWTLVIAGLIVASAVAVGAGTWYFEVRRRARRRAGEQAAPLPRQRSAG